MTDVDLQVTDYDVPGNPDRVDVAVLASSLSAVLIQELDGASAALGVRVEDVLLATFCRTISRTIGDGVVAVDTASDGRTRLAVPLSCVGPQLLSATDMLTHVRCQTTSVDLHQMVHGVTSEQPVSQALFIYGTDRSAWSGHRLDVHVHRIGDVIGVDWRYDTRSFEPYTVEELAEQFPLALIELTSEATVPELTPVELAMSH